jgi:hypothetical protein
MASGLAVTLPWPMLSSTICAGFAGGGRLPPGLLIGRRSSTPKPNSAAASASAPAGSRAPSSANAVLQLCAKAVRTVTVPRSAFSWLCTVRPLMTVERGQAIRLDGVTPCRRAAAAVMTLKVEPGG